MPLQGSKGPKDKSFCTLQKERLTLTCACLPCSPVICVGIMPGAIMPGGAIPGGAIPGGAIMAPGGAVMGGGGIPDCANCCGGSWKPTEACG